MRIAIAQEIHDGIAQDLIALGYQIDLVLAQPHTPSSVRHEMSTIRHDLSDLIIKVGAKSLICANQVNSGLHSKELQISSPP